MLSIAGSETCGPVGLTLGTGQQTSHSMVGLLCLIRESAQEKRSDLW